MSLHADGTATCDGCGVWLPGYGVLHGMVGTDIHDGAIRHLIWCYLNECRTAALAGILFPQDLGSPPICSRHGDPLPRSIGSALLLADMPPDTTDIRYAQLCYDAGARDEFITVNTRSAP